MKADFFNPYSVSKLAGENMCRVYYDLFGLETITFRYFNVYGPREPVRGEYAPVVGKFLNQRKNKIPMSIVGDGLQRRDFTHVKDVVRANLLASVTYNDYAFGQVFNVGAGENYSIIELARMIGGSYSYGPERLGEAKETLACIDKGKDILGWSPTVDFESYILGAK